MDTTRHPRAALAALVVVTTLGAGCSAPDPSTSNPSNTAAPVITPTRSQTASSQPVPSQTVPSQTVSPQQPASPTDSHGRGGRGNGPSAAAVGLPADWPPELPVPAGSIVGSTGAAGRWSVLIVAAGSAAQVRQSTVAFYSAAGFTAVSDSVLNKGNRQITLVVENRDHSATQTNLVIGVTTG
jgi:hypothetical protein